LADVDINALGMPLFLLTFFAMLIVGTALSLGILRLFQGKIAAGLLFLAAAVVLTAVYLVLFLNGWY